MIIKSSFTSNGQPCTRLIPTIRIRDAHSGRLLIANANMHHIGDGAYTFPFSHSDNVSYSVRVDGGVDFDDHERYQFTSFCETGQKIDSELQMKKDCDCMKLENSKIIVNRVDSKFLNRNEKRLRNALKRIFDKQKDWIIDNINDEEFDERIEFFLRNMPGVEDIADRLFSSEALSMRKGGKTIIKSLKLSDFGISFSLQHPEAKSYLRTKHTIEKLSNFRGNISGRTKTKITDILVKGIAEGKSPTELAKLIRKQGDAGVFSIARGEHIAQREIGMAYAKGNRIPIDDFAREFPDRPPEKRWNTVKDSKVRATHTTNEKDGWIPLAQNHSGTGEDQAPSQEWRCRCTETFKVD